MSILAESPVMAYSRGLALSEGEHGGMRIAVGGRPVDEERATIIDVSAIPKRLLAGTGVAQCCADMGLDVPPNPFTCVEQQDGAVIANLHHHQYLWIASPTGSGWSAEFESYDSGKVPSCINLPFECAEFAVLGPHQEDLLLELTAVDPSALMPNTWHTVRLAHAEVAIRQIESPARHLRVICSPADAIYLFALLCEVTREFHGEVTGLDRYLEFVSSAT